MIGGRQSSRRLEGAPIRRADEVPALDAPDVADPAVLGCEEAQFAHVRIRAGNPTRSINGSEDPLVGDGDVRGVLEQIVRVFAQAHPGVDTKTDVHNAEHHCGARCGRSPQAAPLPGRDARQGRPCCAAQEL